MSANQMARLAELENQAFSLMGRLHVALRRETGRITDVEYMRIDPAYCRHLIQLALQSGHPDLQKIGERLHDIYFGEDGLFVMEQPRQPLLARLTGNTAPPASRQVEPMPPYPDAPAPVHPSEEPPKPDQHYVGRLR